MPELTMRLTPLLALSLALTACGDDVIMPAGPVTLDEGEGGGGEGGGGVAPLSLVQVKAPTETAVKVIWSAEPPPEAAYAIAGEGGPLAITGMTVNGATVELTTEKQKLGVAYELTVSGVESQALSKSFPSADTARFWTTDLSSPSFEEHEVVAERKAIGTHAVAYVQVDMPAADYQQAIAFFDDSIYPIETALFAEPGDIDENGKIVLLGLDGKGAYGGYFSPMNSLPNEETMANWNRHSNEMEMLYINLEYGSWYADSVIAHELEHLLYNERHGWMESWDYHNEGLAECAVNAVNGQNAYALDYYVADPSGAIANGLSLVHWQYANYDNYVLAYVFWSYVASQLGGTPAYGELFDRKGDPAAIEQYLQAELGLSFAATQLQALAATHIQAPTGPWGFEGLLTFPASPPLAGSPPSQLMPFAGALVSMSGSSIDYSGGEGDNVVFAGIGSGGLVDLAAPFDVSGGVLVMLNKRFDVEDPTPEPTGLPVPPKTDAASAELARHGRWHPPPFDPRLERMRHWQRQVGLR